MTQTEAKSESCQHSRDGGGMAKESTGTADTLSHASPAAADPHLYRRLRARGCAGKQLPLQLDSLVGGEQGRAGPAHSPGSSTRRVKRFCNFSRARTSGGVSQRCLALFRMCKFQSWLSQSVVLVDISYTK